MLSLFGLQHNVSIWWMRCHSSLSRCFLWAPDKTGTREHCWRLHSPTLLFCGKNLAYKLKCWFISKINSPHVSPPTIGWFFWWMKVFNTLSLQSTLHSFKFQSLVIHCDCVILRLLAQLSWCPSRSIRHFMCRSTFDCKCLLICSSALACLNPCKNSSLSSWLLLKAHNIAPSFLPHSWNYSRCRCWCFLYLCRNMCGSAINGF